MRQARPAFPSASRRTRRWCALGAALLSGCGPPDSVASPPPEAVRAALNLAEAELTVAPSQPADRLTPLAESELPARFQEKPSCRLLRSGQLLVASSGDAAIARVDGRLQLIPRAGPVDPSGAFFRGSDVTIGVGRIGGVASGAEVSGIPRRAGVTIGGKPKVDLQKFQAEWACYW